MPPRRGRWMRVLAAAAVALAAVARAQVPITPVSYQMNRSTIIMPCNMSGAGPAAAGTHAGSYLTALPIAAAGYTDPASTVGWSVIDFDWSNAKQLWAKAQPMDCEERLLVQARRAAADRD